MKSNITRKIFTYLALYFAIPLLVLEIFSQFRFSTGYFLAFLKYIRNTDSINSLINQKAELHPPNLNLKNLYKTIYGDPKIYKKIDFKTDIYGTINPSSIEKNKYLIDKSILFCGGSSTEGVAIQESKRVADIYTNITKVPSINTGKSGKDLEGCLKTIDYFLQNHGKPKAIVIANNLNTIPNFISKNHASLSIKIKRNIRKILPGLYTTLFEINKKRENYLLFKKDKLIADSQLPAYEIALSKGCCFGPASVNKKWGYLFNWDDDDNKKDYSNHIKNLGIKLKTILENSKYPYSRVFIFIEPNSFLSKFTSSYIDYRQFLHDESGKKLNGKNSARIIKIYDEIYRDALIDIGFNILEVNPEHIKGEYFYDAGHLSPTGAKFLGEFFAEKIE